MDIITGIMDTIMAPRQMNMEDQHQAEIQEQQDLQLLLLQLQYHKDPLIILSKIRLILSFKIFSISKIGVKIAEKVEQNAFLKV